MSKHDTWHRASTLFFESENGEGKYYCAACGKEVTTVGTGITPRHKGNVSSFKNGLTLSNRDNQVIAVVAGSYHGHSGY